MNISLIAMHLDEASFAHVGDYLTRPLTAIAKPGHITLETELLKGLEPGRYAVRLRAKTGPENEQYRFRVSYVAVLQTSGDPPDDIDRRLAVTGAGMLMPFVREAVGNLTSRGRFGSAWIAPVNFAAEVFKAPPKGSPKASPKVPGRARRRRRS